MSSPIDVKMETPIIIKTEQEEFEDLTIHSIFPTEDEGNNFIPLIKTEIPEEITNSRLLGEEIKPEKVGKNKSRKRKAHNNPIKQEINSDSSSSSSGENEDIFNQVSILKNFKCLTCGQLFKKRDEKFQHIRTIHQNELLFHCKVEGCLSSFRQKSQLLNHHRDKHKVFHWNSIHINKKGQICEKCNKRICEKNRFKLHQKSCGIKKEEESKNNPNACPICFKVLKVKSAIKKHMRLHDTNEKLPCSFCAKNFDSQHTLNSHVLKNHPEKAMPHKCESCTSRFVQIDEYQEHLASHFHLRIYDCDHCKEKFEDLSELNSHLSIYHSHVKPFKCGECKKTFNQRISLIRHEWKHKTELKPWHCNVCKGNFGVKADLKNHLKEHEKNREKKLLNCDKCSKKFAVPQMLEIHTAFHNLKDVKPFCCEGCELRFKTKEKMNNHFKIH